MISTTLNSATSLFNYNGDGVRLKQIVAGVVTTYTQDVAAPLPVVLQSRTGVTTTKYLYATATRPLAQNATAWEYLLPDALGSVRQIANANAYIIRTQDYEPYGSMLSSSGSGQSVYGFTGEERDQSGLIFLRARYLQPRLGIFLARDPWSGDAMRPGSMNGFNYVEGNPVNRVDPSGKAPPWPNEDQAITALKPHILASASRHNTPLTNMDDNSFAALMTVILHWEGRLPGNGKPVGTIFDKSSQSRDAAGDLAGATIGYDATTGYSNIRPSVALEILEGKIPGLARTFCYKIEGGYDYNSLMWASFWTGIFGAWMRPEEILFGELQRPKISVEYLAANLQRGADRITGLGFRASVFNLASWHHQGIQTPLELRDPDRGPKATDYANTMLASMSDGFDALGLPLGKFLRYTEKEKEFVNASLR